MKRALSFALTLTLLGGTQACIGCWQPPSLSPTSAHEVTSESAFPSEGVEVLVDDKGVPHIYSESENDSVYALGYMHARERRWQMLFSKFASQGRLAEILGADLLDADRFLRLMSYAADRQLAALSDREIDLVNAYCEGVNLAAKEYGATAEMAITGAEWEDFVPRDVITIALLFTDDQSLAMGPELSRARIQDQFDPGHPLYNALIQRTPSGGVPIVSPEEHTGELANVIVNKSSRMAGRKVHTSPRAQMQKLLSKYEGPFSEDVNTLLQNIWQAQGASNSWVVSGDFTESGAPVLTNDPHLGHSAPGIFYLVHFESENESVAGVTFPGLPGVLIGHGRNMSWGITNAYGDCQDLVRIQNAEGRTDAYELDGEAVEFETITQRYKLSQGDDAEVFEEEWKTTVFGPLLPSGRDFLFAEDTQFAYMWCSDYFADENSELFTAFWDLAKADNIEEVDAALERVPGPPLNVVLAFTDGTIAYRLAGKFPERLSDEPTHLPRDGRFSSAGWGEEIPYGLKPQITNPERGFIVAANQRIVDDEGPLSNVVGGEASSPYRALRVTERLEELLTDDVLNGRAKVSADQLLEIQQDVYSVEARRMSPIFARYCPRTIKDQPLARVGWFCEELQAFDGRFTKESKGALLYDRFIRQFLLEVLETHIEVEPSRALTQSVRLAISDAAIAEQNGVRSVIFDDPNTPGRDGLESFVVKAAKRTLDEVYQDFGSTPDDWRWGKVHAIQFKGRLSGAPVIGSAFQTAQYEESGCGTCVRAESGFPVSFGAGMRHSAEMTTPVNVRMVIDTGQSGHFGSEHLEDLYPLWSAGQPFKVAPTKDEVNAALEGSIVISPK